VGVKYSRKLLWSSRAFFAASFALCLAAVLHDGIGLWSFALGVCAGAASALAGMNKADSEHLERLEAEAGK
jgi:hypothetical protein